MIMAITGYALWWSWRVGPSDRQPRSEFGVRLVAFGLVLIGLFYFADLVSMYILPTVTSVQDAMAFMGTLHRNFSWLVALFAVFAVTAGFIELKRTQIELAEKNELLTNLSSKLAIYLPRQWYNSIFSGTHSPEIAATRKKLTISFSDIADFTATSDSLESEELTHLLNLYLTEMAAVATSYGATIDKYIGDAILAFFGDPTSNGSKGDAIACVKMAISMQRRMSELQLDWLDLGLEKPFQLRIGINTGSVPWATLAAWTGWTIPSSATR